MALAMGYHLATAASIPCGVYAKLVGLGIQLILFLSLADPEKVYGIPMLLVNWVER